MRLAKDRGLGVMKYSSIKERAEHLKNYYDCSDEYIEKIFDRFSEEEIKDGYTIYWNAGEVPGALSVGIIPELNDDKAADCEAADYYEEDQGKIIRDIPTDKYYIDTPENRKLVEDYVNQPGYHPVLTSVIKAGRLDRFQSDYNIELWNGETITMSLDGWYDMYPEYECYVWNDLLATIYIRTKESALNDYFNTYETTRDYFVYSYIPLERFDAFLQEKGGIAKISVRETGF